MVKLLDLANLLLILHLMLVQLVIKRLVLAVELVKRVLNMLHYVVLLGASSGEVLYCNTQSLDAARHVRQKRVLGLHNSFTHER